MKWIKNHENFVVDIQTGDVQCLLPKNEDKLRDKMIELAPELFATASSFVEQMESGTFPAKSIYNEFKQILSQVPEELYDKRMQVQ